jgi:hypothetical protein
MTTALQGLIESGRLRLRANPALLLLIILHSVVCCASLVQVARYQHYIYYDGDRLFYGIVVAAAFSSISLLLAAARFSFGYFVTFYFYTMILGFLWIDVFTKHTYDHAMAGVSAVVSFLMFAAPALLIGAPLKRAFELSPRALERVLLCMLALSAATVAVASTYNFRLISLAHIYEFRDEIEFPSLTRYLVNITSTALLPFAFASYLALNRRWWAAATLLLMLFYYPITLSKSAFFAPAWIIALFIASKIFENRTTIVLSLFLPMLLGLLMILTVRTPYADSALVYFNFINIRMVATPSSALDLYNEFFSDHPLTHFCQISFLTSLMHCPYHQQLAVVMQDTYGYGNLNASLFATEGVASVGLILAPLTALACGFVIALGNRASAGLPSRFVIISAAMLPQQFLNVPLTTMLLTHGAAVIFLLWYTMPRSIFMPGSIFGGEHEEPK